jgi:hypothetical protein
MSKQFEMGDSPDIERALEILFSAPTPDTAFVAELEQQLLAQKTSPAGQNVAGEPFRRSLSLHRWAAEKINDLRGGSAMNRHKVKRWALAIGGAAVLLVALLVGGILWEGPSERGLPPLPLLSSMPALAQEWDPQRPFGALGDVELVLEAELPEEPDEAPVYYVTAEPVPSTPEEALSWAERFGLSEPKVYRDPRDPDVLTVIGSGEERLVMRWAPFGEVYYSSGGPAGWPQGPEPPSFEAAKEAAVAFLRDHGLLPEAYRVEEPDYGTPPDVEPPPIRYLRVVPEIDGYPVEGLGSEMSITVGPDGQVLHASLRQMAFERTDVYPLKSAGEAFEELRTGDHKGPFRLSINWQFPTETEPVTRYTPEAPEYAVGDEVTVRGHVQLLQEVGGDDIRATLSVSDGLFELSGSALAEMTDVGYAEVGVRGTIEEKLGSRGWRLAVERWEKAPPRQVDHFLVAVESVGETVIVETEDGTRYRLLDPPADLHQGQPLAVYAEIVPAEGGELPGLRWSGIESPPATHEYAVSSESVSVEVAVEKEVIEAAPPPGEGHLEGGGVSDEVAALRVEPGSEPPQSPYKVGDEVEIEGMISAVIYTDGTYRKVEASLMAGLGPVYEWHYQLSGSPELLEELAQHHRLHLRVKGHIVAEGEYPQGQTLEVESFEKIWPDERLQGYLGTISIETLESREVAIFTDEETGQRYVPFDSLTPHFTRDQYQWSHQHKHIYLEGVERPDQTFASLPVIEVAGTRAGSRVDAATSADQLLLEHPQVIDERTMPERMKGKAIIDLVELGYYAPPGALGERPGAEVQPEFSLVQPVWVFHGHSEDGRATFHAYVQAVADDYLQ